MKGTFILKSVKTYGEFYSMLDLPSWAPPSWLFGVAWSIIYPLFIAATVVVAVMVVRKRAPRKLLVLLLVNWAANLAFTPVQLGLEPLWPASVVILIVLGSLVWFQVHAWKKARTAFWLLVPYLAWGLFAAVLQLTITATN